MAVGYSSDRRVVAKLASLVAFCARHLSRASRRLLRDRRCYGGAAMAVAGDNKHQQQNGDGGGEGIIWRRTILMGERCEPLDFDGAIHYDSFGRRLPAPRSASSLSSSCCSSNTLASYIPHTSPPSAHHHVHDL
uniref:Uncharacterized protein n=1 Tax=Leersia perrieri TaxID=77586 RepID=A0A0D9WKF6_9ORYZ